MHPTYVASNRGTVNCCMVVHRTCAETATVLRGISSVALNQQRCNLFGGVKTRCDDDDILTYKIA